MNFKYATATGDSEVLDVIATMGSTDEIVNFKNATVVTGTRGQGDANVLMVASDLIVSFQIMMVRTANIIVVIATDIFSSAFVFVGHHSSEAFVT